MKQELIALRKKMQDQGIDIYMIPTTDFHGSEYVNDYFKCRRFVSGFTGSAGTLVVTADWAGLWTDGRYFLQAAAELADSGIELMKMGEPDVPTVEEFINSTPGTLGFDGRVVDYTFLTLLSKPAASISYNMDLVGEIWADRPQIQPSEIYALSEEITGERAESKLARVRRAMAEKGADYHLIPNLEEIAWLYNLRGADVENTPVFFAFVLITPDEDLLYTMDKGNYLDIFEDLAKLPAGKILLDESRASVSLIKALPKDVEIINSADPAELMKAIKNPAEIAATKHAHRKDGAAMAEFICWLKGTMAKDETLTEIAASDYLESCRRAKEGCFDLSFDTISGYMDNGAIVHYSATPETNKVLEPRGLLLVDSGGQYTDGTTDITRTIALGQLSDAMKEHYTLVLKSHIQLEMARFARGTTGAQLDVIARRPLRDAGLDFNHGTGHGVGHLLSVHEGPNTISPRGKNSLILPGMITTDEPGLYFEGEYGIRLENELLCLEEKDGTLYFEPITFCPFEREAILPEMLTEEELAWLNKYHQEVFDRISPLVAEPVKAWLKEATKEM